MFGSEMECGLALAIRFIEKSGSHLLGQLLKNPLSDMCISKFATEVKKGIAG
jgi:hypothetical protein